jgi:hypothetical protein
MADYQSLYKKFLETGIALEVYEGNSLLFASNQEMLAPLLEYIRTIAPRHKDIVVFDKIMGNAAALLCVIAKCKEIYSPLGSDPAIETLEKFGISHHIGSVVPFIKKPNLTELCPMEKISLGKTPEEFYQILKSDTPKMDC